MQQLSNRRRASARSRLAVAFASALRELRASGISRRALADELNRRGVPTERNGRWHYTTVVRMLTRLGMVSPAAGGAGAGMASRRAALVRAQRLAPLIRKIQSAYSLSNIGGDSVVVDGHLARPLLVARFLCPAT